MSTRNNPINLSIILFFLIIIIIIPSTFSLSFNLSTIGRGRSINITGNASITSHCIQLTSNKPNRTGRATYMEPLHLWDRASRNLTDFTTHFSFVIDSSGSDDYADGLAFFLAPNGSSIQPWSQGAGLGIGNGSVSLNSSAYSFVAVEFDTYFNDFDPRGGRPHVGIDINSMVSVNTKSWESNVTGGAQNDAWISYNATSLMLRVIFTQGTTSLGSLSHRVDLRHYLPEYVTFGFTASNGGISERHIVTSWQFYTNLERIVAPHEETTPPLSSPSPLPQPPYPPPSSPSPSPSPLPQPSPPSLPPPQPSPPPPPQPESRTGLIVGLSVGLPVVLSGVALTIYCLWKK